MTMFLVQVLRTGPEYQRGRPTNQQSRWREHADFMNALEARRFIVMGGPVDDERVFHAIEAASEEEIRATFARDPWHETHVRIASIEPWTLLLDSRRPR
jgi:hypothetical protein